VLLLMLHALRRRLLFLGGNKLSGNIPATLSSLTALA
jgi:hypothetical protein